MKTICTIAVFIFVSLFLYSSLSPSQVSRIKNSLPTSEIDLSEPALHPASIPLALPEPQIVLIVFAVALFVVSKVTNPSLNILYLGHSPPLH